MKMRPEYELTEEIALAIGTLLDRAAALANLDGRVTPASPGGRRRTCGGRVCMCRG